LIELKEIVTSKEFDFECIKSVEARDVIKHMLVKDATKRATID